ncbi:MAG: Cell division coordinator CpoB [Chroococcopsis gigantea SAG 12.99]|jgi:soluble lytic murein transglycosylase|nr:transglycosylase SLT domain-containing protein [Chlorogloea purpurea SAG 13.99]MDV3001768.1 Cell division coordinator CpoB [Chroococcopsis gigantea SAG 12.99]
MLKKLQTKPALLLGLGSGLALILLSGGVLLHPGVANWLDKKTPLSQTEKTTLEAGINKPSAVTQLVDLPSAERIRQLKLIADGKEVSIDRSRARYLLASGLLQDFEGGRALLLLDGLEKEYPILAEQILLKRGRAYELTNNKEKAKETWKQLVETYPKSTVVAEAYYYLGKYDPSYHEKLLTQYPRHPQTLALLRQKLKENPDQPDLLLQLAKANPYDYSLNEARERLVKKFPDKLKPEDWDIIGDAYWQQAQYPKATKAYAKATRSSKQAYRYARGLHIQKKNTEAIKAYGAFLKAYPKSEETGLALIRLAQLSPPAQATAYLDRVVRDFSDLAPRALNQKAELLDKTNPKAANDTRKILLTKYASSDEAAELRWKYARLAAKAGNYLQAWQWAQPIAVNNADSTVAPKAAFWVGKWAQKLGKQKEAQDAFTHTLGRYPHSYYAWRSAVNLGWDVGDFNDVRSHDPVTVKPKGRPVLPVGSPAFKELYLLGEDRDAWSLFAAEVADPWNLTVDEQFNLGLYKLSQNQNLEGINLIWSLRERETNEEKERWKTLRESNEYWNALYPFPYYDLILQSSKQRQLNPLLVTALIRQESRFEKDIRSPVGAVGLMQVMPDTGKFIAKQTNVKDYSLTDPEDNISFGTWYLDYTHDKYKNNSLLAVASYNAGPGNVGGWLKRFSTADEDEFVEQIPFKETKGYVESVFGNYWNYLQIYNPEISKRLATLPKPSN